MSHRTPRRLSTTILVVLSLLFSQLALAGYVCPKQQNAAAMAELMAAGQACAGMDDEQPALCAEYSAGAPQSTETVKVPVLATPVVIQLAELPFRLQALAARAVPTSAAPQGRPPPDPLFLSTLRLRV